MQEGLRTWAQATLDLTTSVIRRRSTAGTGCTSDIMEVVSFMNKAATGMRDTVRGVVVDYGVNIKYEALKSLEVRGVPLMEEVNGFIGIWKFENKQDAGYAYAALLGKFYMVMRRKHVDEL